MGSKILLQQQKKAKRTDADLFGAAILFPPQPSPSGDLATVSGMECIQQSLEDLFDDFIGEVPFHEDMGGEALKAVSRKCTQANADRISFRYKQLVMKHEGRIKEISIIGTPVPAETASDPDILQFDIEFTAIQYHHPLNFTYDLVLREGNK